MDIPYDNMHLYFLDNNLYYIDYAGKIHKTELEHEPKSDPLPDYKSYTQTKYISEKINENPIDESYEHNEPESSNTISMVEFSIKYAEFWQTEMDNALNILTDNLTDEVLEKLKSQQKSWEEYSSNSTPSNIYIESYGYGTGMQLQDSAKYLLEVRQRAMELIEYCIMITGDYEFIYSE